MKKYSILLLIAFATLFSNNAFAQITEVQFNTRVEQAQVLVEGKVVSKRSFWDNLGHNIYTANEVEVYKVFKGVISVTRLEIITPGGTVGYNKEVVEPSLSLAIGDIGVFMLEPNNIDIENSRGLLQFKPYASLQGFVKYDIENDKARGAFESFNGIENQFYNSIINLTQTEYTVINSLKKSNNTTSLLKAASITNFSPTTATAGTETTITINGSGFGASAGTVRFSKADDGGATFVDGLATEIISWNDAQIVVEVYQEAGTGFIQVVGTSTATSAQTLTVSYAESNAEYDPGSGLETYQTRHIDRNGNGGYVWQMHTDFDASAANAAFVRSFETWRCNSGIYWELGATTTTDVIANDDINIIRFDNGGELPNGTLGRCTSRWSGCGGATIEWYVEELDIVFDDGTNWNYTTSAPGFTEYDFESVSVHELGHGHQLGHVINTNDVMHYAISNGEQNRTPNANNLAGAADVQSRSTGGAVCGETVMTNYNCGSAPVAAFSGDLTTVCEGGSVSFTDASTGTPTSWSWDFGDGGSSTSQSPSYNYNTAGTYTVTLTATNATGSDDEVKTNYITVNANPDLSSTSSTDETCTGNDGTATVTPAPVGTYSYSWNTGPVQTTPTALGLAAATYNVTVTNTSTTCFASTNVAVGDACAGSAPVADFSGTPTTICEGNSVSFTDLSTNTATSWSWSFTGGTPSTSSSENPTITYNTAGTYAVVLTSTNAFGSSAPETKVGYITVNACGTTYLRPEYEKTFSSYAEILRCIPVENAQEYEWEFTPSGGGGSITYNWGIPNVSILLNFVTGLIDGTTYDVRVRAKVGGVFGGFGLTKQLTTPSAVAMTNIVDGFCGKSYATLTDVLNAYPVSGATNYEFEFDPVGGGSTITHEHTSNSILLSWVSGFVNNTIYDVRVRSKVGGTYGAFGSSCQITTPASDNLTSLTDSHCGKVYTSYTELLNAFPVSTATDYEFEFDPVGGGLNIVHSNPGNSMLLNYVPGLANSTQYDVRVRSKVGGVFYDYGSSCQITTPAVSIGSGGTTSRLANIEGETKIIPASVIIYPNPNQGEYLYVELADLAPNSELIVTDVFGKQIERMRLDTEQSNYKATVRFDNKLSPGFYMVTVISNGQTTTKKLIVR